MTNAVVVLTSLVMLGLVPPSAQDLTDLAGTWTLQHPVGATLESVVPAVETIAIEASVVTLVRGTAPPSTERYAIDDVERLVTRVRAVARACRAVWRPPQLVITCLQPDRGPGGQAASIVTREVRSLDPEGRLVVESLWRSGDRQTTERRVYVRQPQ